MGKLHSTAAVPTTLTLLHVDEPSMRRVLLPYKNIATLVCYKHAKVLWRLPLVQLNACACGPAQEEGAVRTCSTDHWHVYRIVQP